MTWLRIPSVMASVALLVVGCNKNNPTAATSELEKTFQLNGSASGGGKSDTTGSGGAAESPDQVQQMVSQAVSAIKTNAYVEAAALLQTLKAQPVLTPDQRIAVQDASVAVLSKVADAAERGDPAAIKAVEAIKGMSRR